MVPKRHAFLMKALVLSRSKTSLFCLFSDEAMYLVHLLNLTTHIKLTVNYLGLNKV